MPNISNSKRGSTFYNIINNTTSLDIQSVLSREEARLEEINISNEVEECLNSCRDAVYAINKLHNLYISNNELINNNPNSVTIDNLVNTQLTFETTLLELGYPKEEILKYRISNESISDLLVAFGAYVGGTLVGGIWSLMSSLLSSAGSVAFNVLKLIGNKLQEFIKAAISALLTFFDKLAVSIHVMLVNINKFITRSKKDLNLLLDLLDTKEDNGKELSDLVNNKVYANCPLAWIMYDGKYGVDMRNDSMVIYWDILKETLNQDKDFKERYDYLTEEISKRAPGYARLDKLGSIVKVEALTYGLKGTPDWITSLYGYNTKVAYYLDKNMYAILTPLDKSYTRSIQTNFRKIKIKGINTKQELEQAIGETILLLQRYQDREKQLETELKAIRKESMIIRKKDTTEEDVRQYVTFLYNFATDIVYRDIEEPKHHISAMIKSFNSVIKDHLVSKDK